MRYPVLLGLVVGFPVAALAEDGGKTEQPRVSTVSIPVIGGSAAPKGKWPDAVALLWGGSQACTGTLIAPSVVLTAGHCVADGAPDAVLIGASALSRAQEGETITVTRAIEYPNSWNTVDAGILLLAKPSTFTPRAIATGWAKFDIKNGAQVQLVGFGTTDRNASMPTDALMEATTTITDYNCTAAAGCNQAAQPDGELGAGGMGVDTCPGDSGGPVYLLTPYGEFLTGITSRGYDTNNFYCSEGGIYGRPDKVVDWIEQQAGVKVTHGPAPSAEPVVTVRGDAGETQIKHNDPKSGAAHLYEITTPPQYGTAKVRSDGLARVCARKDVAGDDFMIVSVVDQAEPTRKVDVRIPIIIQDGDPPDDCDVDDFGGSAGCCDTRRSAGGSIPLALAVLLVLRRRRK